VLVVATVLGGCKRASDPAESVRVASDSISTSCEQQMDELSRAVFATLESPKKSLSRRREEGVIGIGFVVDDRVLYDVGVSDRPTFELDSPFRPSGFRGNGWFDEPSSRPEQGELVRARLRNGREGWIDVRSADRAEAERVFHTFSTAIDQCLDEPLAPQTRRFELIATVKAIEPLSEAVHRHDAVSIGDHPTQLMTLRAESIDPETAMVGLYRDHWIAIADATAFGGPAASIVGKRWAFDFRAEYRAGHTTWQIDRVAAR
jgi:hypothetical protein